MALANPVAGGSGRFPYYCHGPVAGFTAGWASWLQAVFIAPLEILAAITYVNSVGWVNQHFNMISKVGENAGDNCKRSAPSLPEPRKISTDFRNCSIISHSISGVSFTLPFGSI